ncbi:T-lymphocyte surface antigen Ly-9-like isoform X5 [Brienomyrus brachyistius]|uniref:T-lymphocyte surface antigen Ly-9-like isoform X5 n=1 Tax=Brienomyrus brachyistius TaxID=42636 RepID=UPI0020B3BA62|nr:T-lymphocyte surface antigen Ly-9-like isoform X5 [Brienomyrus brachyistius]
MNRKIALILGALLTVAVETDSSPAEPPVYQLKGASVHLTVESLQHLQIKKITWKLNSTTMLDHTVANNYTDYYSGYKEKMQFDSRDFSLLIKNLDETDQGTYTAVITETSGADSEKAKYCLHVQEAVAKPIIQMNNSTLDSPEGFCNVSVNCSVRDSWVYYTCDQTQCSQTEPQSWPDVNITVTVYNGKIICTGSNWVSKETQSEPLGDACRKTAAMSVSPSSWYIWLILGIVFLCLCIGFIYFLCLRNSKGELDPDGTNTEYTVPMTANRAHPPNTSQDNTLYCTVGHPKELPPGRPPPAHCDDTSIYSQVKK